MATLSSSVSSIHRDIRSEARSYKRDKDHSTKWAMGGRASPGVKCSPVEDIMTTGSPAQHAKMRPMPKWSSVECKTHANIVSTKSNPWNLGRATGRIKRNQDVMWEIASSPPVLSRSLIDILPAAAAAATTTKALSPAVDADITYSFDAPASPRKVVGLDSLVERAEREFKARETDKIVRDEYEILDDEGEITVLAGRNGGKKATSPKQMAQVFTAQEEEDDWERI